MIRKLFIYPHLFKSQEVKMDYKDCIKFANENPVCYVATADGDQPRVWGLLMWFADETGFFFIPGRQSRFVSN
jgi:nitroimidazol reductase NimA-like FMN-containing flavoprotein (pyridoxamine 5'-phosphate oxidase superfamily)